MASAQRIKSEADTVYIGAIMTTGTWPPIDPSDVDIRHAIFCSESGLNDGSASDSGDLQGATISTIDSVTAGTGLTVDSSNKNQTVIQETTYAINTIVNVWLSAGVDQTYTTVTIKVTLSDSRELERSFAIEVKDL